MATAVLVQQMQVVVQQVLEMQGRQVQCVQGQQEVQHLSQIQLFGEVKLGNLFIQLLKDFQINQQLNNYSQRGNFLIIYIFKTTLFEINII